MIPGILTKVLIKQIAKHFKLAKLKKDLEKAKKYVDEPNELDIKVQGNSGDIIVLKKLIQMNSDDIRKLKEDSHPRSEFICTDCGCKAKRVKKEK